MGKQEWQGFILVVLSDEQKRDFKQWWPQYLAKNPLEYVVAGLAYQGKLSLTFDIFNDCYLATMTYGDRDKNRPSGWSVTFRHSEMEVALGYLSYADLHDLPNQFLKEGKVKKGKIA